jgi:2-polyprenyl-3-methyl-5-hydroxy-6-metoxy-1,4-benzoquinol methylase
MAIDQNVDASNGYEAVADDFIAIRDRASIGADTVRDWANSLRPGGNVLDIGSGHGSPVSKTLVEQGFKVYAVDASPRLVAVFRARFPEAQVECAAVENSQWFNRKFDGVVAWGLMFLLAPDTQASVISKVAASLVPGGQFLFTAPHQQCEWRDLLTNRECISLGATVYQRLLETAGLALIGDAEDEGQNYYYLARKREG